jgi:transcriptional regulator with XRE-family HTH domain
MDQDFIPTKLKEFRKEKNLSQSEVAKAIGVTQASYSKYESGETQMTYQVMFKLADFYGITIDELLGHKPLNGLIDKKTLEILHKMKEDLEELETNAIEGTPEKSENQKAS